MIKLISLFKTLIERHKANQLTNRRVSQLASAIDEAMLRDIESAAQLNKAADLIQLQLTEYRYGCEVDQCPHMCIALFSGGVDSTIHAARQIALDYIYREIGEGTLEQYFTKLGLIEPKHASTDTAILGKQFYWQLINKMRNDAIKLTA